MITAKHKDTGVIYDLEEAWFNRNKNMFEEVKKVKKVEKVVKSKSKKVGKIKKD